MLDGLRFETVAQVAAVSADRADVACFVGFVELRPGALPADVLRQWEHGGFRELVPRSPSAPSRADPMARPARPLPVAVESFGAFDRLFDGRARTADGLSWEGYLAGAVRDFFRQGGKRCYIVPVGPTAPPPSDAVAMQAALEALVPGSTPGGAPASPSDRTTWRGLGHLHGLPEVALVCLPDLPALVGAAMEPAPSPPIGPTPRPEFVECSEPDPSPPTATVVRAPGPPRLDEAAWDRWQHAAHAALDWIKRSRPDLHLVLALPLGPERETSSVDPLLQLSPRLTHPSAGGLGSGFVQLGYPWVASDTSAERPGGLAPPDGVITGMLARATLAQGIFRSLAQWEPEGVHALSPALLPRAVHTPRPIAPSSPVELALLDRVSLLSLTPRGIRLISDVTPSHDPSWRQGGPNRLMGVLRRSLQRIGEAVAFEASGPLTWRRLELQLDALLGQLLAAGGLADPGYRARCDRTTMAQSDLDAGRLVAVVEIVPAFAVERITILLSVVGPGQVSVESTRASS